MSASFAAYARSRHIFPEQGCLTWIRTGDSATAFADLVRHFGGDPSAVHPSTWADLEGEAYDDLAEEADGIMLAARHSAWTIVMEPFNARGTSLRLLRKAAAETYAYSFRWTVNLQMRVTYVAGGELVAAFDPFDLDTMTPDSGRDWLAGLGVTGEQWQHDRMAAALAAGEELSGVRLDGRWLEQTHLGVQLYPLPVTAPEPADLLDADMRAIAARDPRIGAIAADPTADRLPEIIRIAAELAVTTTGLAGPLIDETMRLIEAGDRGETAQEVRGRLFRLRDQYRADGAGPLLQKERAVQTLIYALKPDGGLAEAAELAIRTAEETHLSEANGDRERGRTLSVIAYYLRTGQSPW
jgi:hypothetical protein